MARKELLTEEQRENFLELNQLSEFEFASYYSLSDDDIAIINKHRRDSNRLGFAIQLCLIRYPGCTLSNIKKVPQDLIQYVASQINVDSDTFSSYATRNTTKREHLEEIRQIYGYKNFNNYDSERIFKLLIQSAQENNNVLFLIQTAINLLRDEKIILPALLTIEKLVSSARNQAEVVIFSILTDELSREQKDKLEKIIDSSLDNQKTPLAWLRELPGHSSPDSFIKVIQRLKYIKNIGLKVNSYCIHPNRFLQLARLGSRYEPHSFRRFEENKKLALLVSHLIFLSQELTDHAIEIHDRQMLILQAKGRKNQEEIQKQNGKSVNEKVIHYADIGMALIKARELGKNPYSEIEKIMSWEKMIESIKEAKSLLRPKDYDYLDLIKSRYNYLRKYTPILLDSLQFNSTQSSNNLLKALNTIHELNISGKRKIPSNAPLDFVPKRWQKHVIDNEGNIDRQYYEMAALTELKNNIRSGSIWVEGSRMHKEFEEYLIPKEEWEVAKQTKKCLAVNLNFEKYIKEKMEALNARLKWISKNIDQIDSINVDKKKIYVERLQTDVPEDARTFSLSLGVGAFF